MALKMAAFVLPLGFDTFAAAVALGLRGLRPLRPALLFALFETVMPFLGIAAGVYAGRWFDALAVYAGGAILVGIGVNVLRETLDQEERSAIPLESPHGMMLAGFGISTDELAMGFPLGALRLPVAPVVCAIGVQAFTVTAAGVWIGRIIGAEAGRQASRIARIAAGIAFILLGGYTIATRLL
ncbi:MAG TPA: manganese efflux pump [bacterium]|nr:manganese efflux pump [bacterium]